MRDRQRSATIFAISLGLLVGCGPTPPTIVERSAWKGHTREIVSIALAPDGKTLATRGADAVKVWDLATGSETQSFPTDGSDFASVAFAPDGKALAANRPGAGVVVWDLATGQEREYTAKPAGVSDRSMTKGWGLTYSPDGRMIADGGSHSSEDGVLTLWSVSDGGGSDLPTTPRPITTVAYSPDGRTIASGSMDGKLMLWDAATRRQRLSIDANRSYLAPVVFSPDGRLVASSNEARWVKLWEVATGRDVGVMKGHVKAVLSLAFSLDGKALVSGDSGGTLFVWEVESRRMFTRLPSDRGKIWGVAFRPDGRTLISTGEDRLIHLWDVTWPPPDGQ